MKKKFRVCVAANTVDGRQIKPEWLTSMASTYNPDTYGARINLEHIRGVTGDSTFAMLGDVHSVDLKQEEVAGETRPVLYAEIEPNDNLIELNKKGQKVYTSVEIQPNFPNEGDFYLVGLAVTDSPASMGTQRLSFSAAEKDKDHLFTSYQEVEFLDEGSADEESDSDGSNSNTDQPPAESIFSRVKKMFSKKTSQDDARFSENESAIETVAAELTKLSERLDNLSDPLATIEQLTADVKAANNKLETLSSELAGINNDLEGSERFSRRPAADGGDSDVKTNC